MRTDATQALQKTIQDGLYITIGLAVLTTQRVQTGGEELARAASERLEDFEARIGAFEARVESTVDALEARLPDQARQVVTQARETAKQAREQLRELTAATR